MGSTGEPLAGSRGRAPGLHQGMAANTNPMLLANSLQRHEVEAAGLEVAFDELPSIRPLALATRCRGNA